MPVLVKGLDLGLKGVFFFAPPPPNEMYPWCVQTGYGGGESVKRCGQELVAVQAWCVSTGGAPSPSSPPQSALCARPVTNSIVSSSSWLVAARVRVIVISLG